MSTADVPKSELLTLPQAATKVAGRKGNASPRTLRRWALEGVRGHRLRYMRVGGTIFTTEQWLREFTRAINEGHLDAGELSVVPASRGKSALERLREKMSRGLQEG